MKHEIIKGTEKDFEQGPEWAMQVDKCIETGHLFYTENIMGSQSGTDKCKWSNESKVRPLSYSANYEDEGFETIAQRRPITEPVWNGEGLPPAGVECEIKRVSDWFPVTIKFISGYYTVILTRGGNEDVFQTCALQFRPIPIRSPEDVARDEAVYDLEHHDSSCESIYDAIAAGKIRGVKLEVK